MAALRKLLEQIGWARAEIIVGEVRGTRAIQVWYTLMLPNGQPLVLTCDPPLNIQMTTEGRSGLLDEEVAAVASDANFASMRKFVGAAANNRNRFLYASERGIPALAQDVEPLLVAKRGNIFSMLMVFLLIYPYRQREPFVCQALRRFLKMTDRLPDGDAS